MAKATALELLNKIQENLGEQKTSSGNLGSLSGLALTVFNSINEILLELATENNYKFQPLEKDGTITLANNTSTYALPSDLGAFDKDSFRYNEERDVQFVTPQRLDREYKTQTDTGIPTIITSWASFFRPYKIPDANANAKVIKYRYWKIPTLLSTSTETGICWIPEGFDLTLLCDLVTLKLLQYKHNSEAGAYYRKVYGDGQNYEGSMIKFRELYMSPDILDENIFVEPMENGGKGGFVQAPITS